MLDTSASDDGRRSSSEDRPVDGYDTDAKETDLDQPLITNAPERRRRDKRYRRLPACLTVPWPFCVHLLLGVANIAFLLHTTRYLVVASPKPPYSPANDAASHFVLKQFEGVVEGTVTPYNGPPGQEVDKAWEELLRTAMFWITKDELETTFGAGYNGFPIPGSDGLMCHADSTLYSIHWYTNRCGDKPDLSTMHVCRDWDALHGWARSRALDNMTLFPGHPLYGNRSCGVDGGPQEELKFRFAEDGRGVEIVGYDTAGQW
ncbi:hypothetical protein QIS74_06992 [Colletotrichum tabaci]|uniref:Oxidase ustYa n=1 Tax=Colletotrichum tabaci TaxID=1209068 RepID=A0AAV9TA23_9PEZI